MGMNAMKCDEARILLTGSADARAEAAGQHVAGCARCREELAQLAADAELLRQDEKPEIPVYLGVRIMAQIRQRQTQPRRWCGLNRAAARVAAVVLVAVGLWIGVALGRGMVGPQQSLPERLAQLGVDLPNGGDI
jgi:anti-sigma factor RsiW